MSAGDGIPRVTAALHEMSVEAASGAANLQRWVSASELGQAAADRMNAKSSPSGTTAIPVSEGLNPTSGKLLDAEGFAAGSWHARNAAEKAFDQKVASQMDDLVSRLSATFGPGNFFASQIAAISGFIKEGRFSGVIGLAYLRAILSNWDAGLVQEIADPRNTPTMRALDYEIEAFIHGGNLR